MSDRKTRRSALEDWPVKLIRPKDVLREEDIRTFTDIERYDEENDKFIPDDGKPGLAFSCRQGGYPVALYVEFPYWDNMLKGASDPWIDGISYDEPVVQHVWHYETRDGQPHFGSSYPDRDDHPNHIAGRRAMNRTSKRFGCANGHGLELVEATIDDVDCAWCKNGFYGHKLNALQNNLRQHKSDVERYEDEIDQKTKEVDSAHITIIRLKKLIVKTSKQIGEMEAEVLS